jgi:hypothetical protein
MYGLDVIAMFIASAFKFAFALPTAVALGYTYGQTLLITLPGGVFGVLFFYFTSTRLMEWNRRRKLYKDLLKIRQGKEVNHRYFNRLNKFIIKVKLRVGILGIAAITPTILGIPLGVIIAAKFFKHKKLTLPILIASVVVWGFAVTTFLYYIKDVVS